MFRKFSPGFPYSEFPKCFQLNEVMVYLSIQVKHSIQSYESPTNPVKPQFSCPYSSMGPQWVKNLRTSAGHKSATKSFSGRELGRPVFPQRTVYIINSWISFKGVRFAFLTTCPVRKPQVYELAQISVSCIELPTWVEVDQSSWNNNEQQGTQSTDAFLKSTCSS